MGIIINRYKQPVKRIIKESRKFFFVAHKRIITDGNFVYTIVKVDVDRAGRKLLRGGETV